MKKHFKNNMDYNSNNNFIKLVKKEVEKEVTNNSPQKEIDKAVDKVFNNKKLIKNLQLKAMKAIKVAKKIIN